MANPAVYPQGHLQRSQQSGCYQHRYWHIDKNGQRVALRRPARDRISALPDLVNTAYRNADGSRTVYGLAFDLDAHRADPRWLDSDGRIDWSKVAATLARDHQAVFHRVAYAVRSTGGRGIAVVLAITPLPIISSTSANQRVALNLQSRLILLFNQLGLGADPGARGLERDYPNFQDPAKCLYENRLALRRAEQGREPTLSILHSYLNDLARAERRNARLYPDARAESGLARLLARLIGMHDPGMGLKVPGYLAGEDVWATTKELVTLTGLSAKFLRRMLRMPPQWLEAAYEGGASWRLRAPLTECLLILLPRAEGLLAHSENSGGGAPKGLPLSISILKEPQLVGADERNAWLTCLGLAYKWHGFTQDEAEAKIALRMQHIPGAESSRNCRQLSSILRAIYRNHPELEGRHAGRDLPSWMIEDGKFQVFGEGTSPRRGVAPVCFGCVSERESGAESVGLSVPKLALASAPTPASSVLAERSPISPIVLAIVPDVTAPPTRQTVKFAAIRWRQRVGIFDGNTLILCVTKRNYRASAALGMLSLRPEYAGIELSIYSPHAAKQVAYRAAIESCAQVVVSGNAFGRKATWKDKCASLGASQWHAASDLGEEPPF